MTPIDRVYATLYHEEPDLVPCLWAVALGLREMSEKVSRRGIKFPFDMIGVGSAINLFEAIESGPDYEVRRSPYGSLRYINYKVKYGYDKMIKAVVSTPEDLESLEPPRLDMDQVMSVKETVKQREGYFTTISHDTPL